jgi:ribokinase
MLVVVGSYNQDLVWRTEAFPIAGQTRIGVFSQGPGGKGFNQAMAAHRLACPTLFIAALGNDALGTNAQKLAHSEALNCAWQICPDSATGNAAIWLDKNGQNQILVDLAANRFLSVEHINTQRQSIQQSKVLLVQQEANFKASLQALVMAKQAGALSIVNPAPAMVATTELHDLADILTPNESEFSALLQSHGTSISAEQIETLEAEKLHQLARGLNLSTVIITLGARGILLSSNTEFHFIAPPSVTVRDTTGAGDCFNGALAAELANGKSMLDACQFAVHASALKVEKNGAALAMPTRAEVLARFK